MASDDRLSLISEIIDLCRKLKFIYNIIACNSEPEANGEVLVN